MELRFSRRADYGIRAALELARAGDRLVKRREIAAAVDAPASVLAQTLADLVRAGIARAVAGPRGGYSLGRPATAITMLDVIHAIEPPPGARRCVLHERACRDEGACPFHHVVVEAEEAYLAPLRAATLAAVAGVSAS